MFVFMLINIFPKDIIVHFFPINGNKKRATTGTIAPPMLLRAATYQQKELVCVK